MELIEHHGKEYRDRKTPKDIVETHQEGVTDNLPEIRLPDEFPEILETHPGTFENAFDNIIVLERHNDAIHRGIVEYKEINNRQEHDQIEVFASFYLLDCMTHLVLIHNFSPSFLNVQIYDMFRFSPL